MPEKDAASNLTFNLSFRWAQVFCSCRAYCDIRNVPVRIVIVLLGIFLFF